MFIEKETESNLLYTKNIHIVNLFLYYFTATIADTSTVTVTIWYGHQ
jgi:hypothetical protein